ncbi:MAG: erythromycin esterase family protein [Marinobacter sp.]|uniref:erythromycin esterase family protein n=1 Tax=Marinobacter sp. TaxID=50741 RepID=UPI00299E5A97|nr:erythromycin esterase family protein [Marinobacter sp.]MDX1634823.1 erythromycin esterase family protein [Marinobacter sp.]
MAFLQSSQPLKQLRNATNPLLGEDTDYDPLLAQAADKSFILLGEATHGTHEFYQSRVEITKRLIREQGLNAVAVEADWPAAYRVNRYIRGLGNDQSAEQALRDFHRFPLWMWRNTVMLDFIEWLADYNDGRSLETQVGFYGLDMYSLYESMYCVLEYLGKVDPEAAEKARESYSCLDHTANEQQYGYGVMLGKRPSCEEEVIRQLLLVQENAASYVRDNGMLSLDEHFQAEQNARLVRNAERYYRTMFTGHTSTWNLRDRHMSDTLDALWKHLSKCTGRTARIAVWEHNSHLGDARATDMGRAGEFNVGQLSRERYGKDALLVGFTTHHGTVSAASHWEGAVERKAVRPALHGSYEGLFHELEQPAFFLNLQNDVPELLNKPRLERAIGVLYLPATERRSHYFNCQLSDQFDSVLHFDATRALEPMDDVSEWSEGAPDTYPFGI